MTEKQSIRWYFVWGVVLAQVLIFLATHVLDTQFVQEPTSTTTQISIPVTKRVDLLTLDTKTLSMSVPTTANVVAITDNGDPTNPDNLFIPNIVVREQDGLNDNTIGVVREGNLLLGVESSEALSINYSSTDTSAGELAKAQDLAKTQNVVLASEETKVAGYLALKIDWPTESLLRHWYFRIPEGSDVNTKTRMIEIIYPISAIGATSGYDGIVASFQLHD